MFVMLVKEEMLGLIYLINLEIRVFKEYSNNN